jgi:hypothetical protein
MRKSNVATEIRRHQRINGGYTLISIDCCRNPSYGRARAKGVKARPSNTRLGRLTNGNVSKDRFQLFLRDSVIASR